MHDLLYYDTLWELKAVISKITYHLLSGYGRIEFEEQAKQQGCDWHTEKEWDVDFSHTQSEYIVETFMEPMFALLKTRVLTKDSYINREFQCFCLNFMCFCAENDNLRKYVGTWIEEFLMEMGVGLVQMTSCQANLFN